MIKWDNVKINEIFQQFGELLEDRFSKQTYTTEDSIRYTLFHCLTHYGGIHPSDIVLEYPHHHISGAEVDTYVPPENGLCGLVFEFKFDRKIPSGKNPPKPQKAGKVFADIFRLAHFAPVKNIRRFFVYVTDREMSTYFQNPSNQLDDFFNLQTKNALRIDKKYISRHPNTFMQSVGKNVINCEIECKLNRNFRSEIWIRIYEVKLTNFR